MHKHGLFATPESWEDLENWILRHSKDQRVSLYTAAHMARNYTIDEYESQQKEEDNDK